MANQADWCNDAPMVDTYARKMSRGPVAKIPKKPKFTRARCIEIARMHLYECRGRRGNKIQRKFRFTLLEWAAKRRLEAMAC